MKMNRKKILVFGIFLLLGIFSYAIYFINYYVIIDNKVHQRGIDLAKILESDARLNSLFAAEAMMVTKLWSTGMPSSIDVEFELKSNAPPSDTIKNYIRQLCHTKHFDTRVNIKFTNKLSNVFLSNMSF
jgi:hypothetical protein